MAAITKTKSQLVEEIVELRKRIAELEVAETERKVVEKALRASEKQYKDLVEKAGIAIAADDVDGNIVYFNETFAALFGYSSEEMNSLSHTGVVHPDDVLRLKEIHEKRMLGEGVPSRY